MSFTEAAQENFRFLIVEVLKQVEDTRSILDSPSQEMIEKIKARDDYIDNLKNFIATRTYRTLLEATDLTKMTAQMLQAINIITGNLEHIADYCTNIVRQTKYLNDPAFIKQFKYHLFFDIIIEGLQKIEDTLFTNNVDLALEICRAEFELDKLFKVKFDKVMQKLREGGEAENLITSLFIIRYLERIGDSLLNIGEAIISAVVGEKLKIHQISALEESFDGFTEDTAHQNGEFRFENISETKSGCRIGRVRDENNGSGQRWVLFKEGAAKKLVQEKENFERWDQLAPGLAPKVYGFEQNKGKASILLEYLPGTTFQKILLSENVETVAKAQDSVHELLLDLWDHTRNDQPVCAHFMQQLRSRLGDVLRLHPSLEGREQSLHGVHSCSLTDLLDEMEDIEEQNPAPFSVFIHGDFNADNILINTQTGKINFIDLHRSQHMDYVQDVSVFLMSNFRMPLFDPAIRSRLNRVDLMFMRFARQYGHNRGDRLFDLRLALGLIRNFITSTRFIIMKDFAKDMALRAKYIMESLSAHNGRPWEEFTLTENVLVY